MFNAGQWDVSALFMPLFLRNLVLLCYRSLYCVIVRLLCHTARKEPAADAKDLLFVRKDYLGDFICALPLLDALSRHVHRRGGRMALVVYPEQGEFALRCGIFDAVEALPVGQCQSTRLYWWLRRRLRRKWSGYHFREAVQGLFNALTCNDLLISAVAARERIRIAGFPDGVGKKYRLHAPYTRAYCYRPELSVQQNDLAFYEFITGEKPQLRPYAEYMPRLTAAELDALPEIPPRCLALVPGASRGCRRWPPERFAAAARWWLAENPENAVAILGSAPEQRLAREIAAALPAAAAARTVDLTGRTDLLQLSALLPRFRAVVGNETGTVHFALCCNVPTVSILGGGDYGIFEPSPLYRTEYCASVGDRHCFGCHWRCRYSGDDSRPFPCVAGISVNAVIEQLRNALQMIN